MRQDLTVGTPWNEASLFVWGRRFDLQDNKCGSYIQMNLRLFHLRLGYRTSSKGHWKNMSSCYTLLQRAMWIRCSTKYRRFGYAESLWLALKSA